MSEDHRRLAQDAHDILRDQGRAREVYRTGGTARTACKCCLVGALALAWENLHGERLLVPERVNGVDVYVFADEDKAEEALRPVMEQVNDRMPSPFMDVAGEFLQYGDMLGSVLLFNDHEDTTDADVLAVLKAVAA